MMRMFQSSWVQQQVWEIVTTSTDTTKVNISLTPSALMLIAMNALHTIFPRI